MALLRDDKREKFYWDVAHFSADMKKALDEGKNLRQIVAQSKIAENSQWDDFKALNSDVIRAMQACPYVLWPDPDGSEQSTKEEVYKSTLVMRWTKMNQGFAFLQAAHGDIDEAGAACRTIHEAAGRILVRGQDDTLLRYGVLADNSAATGYGGIQAIAGRPLSPDDTMIISEQARGDLSFLTSCFERERIGRLKLFKHPPPLGNWFVGTNEDNDIVKLLTTWKFLSRIWIIPIQLEYFRSSTAWREWLRTVPDLKGARYEWNDARARFMSNQSNAVIMLHSYYLGISLVSRWRVVLATDLMLRYYQERQALPDHSDTLDSSWPEDPFDGKPIRYRKTGEKSFIVYSVGPDGTDQEGKPLRFSDRFSDVSDFWKAYDIGFSILIN
jgi:hypothetical protein